MPTLKHIFWAIVAGVVLTLITGVVGFLSAARLEISFDKLKDFQPTDLKSYKALGTSVRFDFEMSNPREFVVFWGEYEDGKTRIRKSDVQFKKFKLSSKIQGEFVDRVDAESISYNIVGYYNSNRIVFSHRGPISGLGIYILNAIQLNGMSGEAYAGYMIVEDIKSLSTQDRWITQCPIVMIQEGASAKKYPTIDAAKAEFPLLQTNCSEFTLHQGR
jgi:hypothetical protein